jgi:hypothetical protein
MNVSLYSRLLRFIQLQLQFQIPLQFHLQLPISDSSSTSSSTSNFKFESTTNSNSNTSDLNLHSNSNSISISVGSCDMSVDYCAMHFHSYSIEELRCIHKQTLHHILSSHSLQIDTEDALLNSLIEVDSDYFDFGNILTLHYYQQIVFHNLLTNYHLMQFRMRFG